MAEKTHYFQYFVFTIVFISSCEIFTETKAGGPPAPYNLGTIPSSIEVRWPALPEITRTVEVNSSNEFNSEAAINGTKIIVKSDITSDVSIRGNDIMVTAANSIQLRRLKLEKSVTRVRIKGGRYERIDFEVPKDFQTGEWKENWLVSNVTIENVRIDSNESGINLRGRRVAVLNSLIKAEWYAIWGGDTGPIEMKYYIIAGNKLKAAGEESTVRIYNSNNGIVVDNAIKNGESVGHKHGLRFHGISENMFVRGNIFINSGSMFGTMPGDHLKRLWLNGNTFYQNSDQLLGLASPQIIENLIIKNNVSYSANWTCFTCGQSGPTWTFENNPVSPYQPAPPSVNDF